MYAYKPLAQYCYMNEINRLDRDSNPLPLDCASGVLTTTLNLGLPPIDFNFIDSLCCLSFIGLLDLMLFDSFLRLISPV